MKYNETYNKGKVFDIVKGIVTNANVACGIICRILTGWSSCKLVEIPLLQFYSHMRNLGLNPGLYKEHMDICCTAGGLGGFYVFCSLICNQTEDPEAQHHWASLQPLQDGSFIFCLVPQIQTAS